MIYVNFYEKLTTTSLINFIINYDYKKKIKMNTFESELVCFNSFNTILKNILF